MPAMVMDVRRDDDRSRVPGDVLPVVPLKAIIQDEDTRETSAE